VKFAFKSSFVCQQLFKHSFSLVRNGKVPMLLSVVLQCQLLLMFRVLLQHNVAPSSISRRFSLYFGRGGEIVYQNFVVMFIFHSLGNVAACSCFAQKTSLKKMILCSNFFSLIVSLFTCKTMCLQHLSTLLLMSWVSVSFSYRKSSTASDCC